ncbi:MAG: erythromycin esterase [Acidobacteria bacterium]|nr:MAG: erythromycin esterase [Acidobacteriota bacterium]
MRYADRRDAGRALARELASYAHRSDVIVLGLPRGGVPVAAEVAAALSAPLDVYLVRKIGVPGQPELAMGAIAEGNIEVLDTRLIEKLDIPRSLVQQVAARAHLELDRHDRSFRAGRAAPVVRDRIVIVVDDGLATGATMEAAVMALRQQKPAKIIATAPVGAKSTCRRLAAIADVVACPNQPPLFSAVGEWYEDFAQTTDDEVRALLAASGRLAPKAHSAVRAPDAIEVIRTRAQRLSGDPSEYDHLVDLLGTARIVLLGEATHGTHEFYRARAIITGKLIERGFNAVAVEADWPDAYRVNRYVRGIGHDRDAADSLADFKRFPAWMWRNADVLDFVGWLRTHNDRMPAERRAGFYGLDLYSLHASMNAVIAYLAKVDPDGAERARHRYACFDRFGEEMQEYAYTAGTGLTASCERQVLDQLTDIRRKAAQYAHRDGRIAADELFYAEENARLVTRAEEYYRTMLGGHVESWNLRDRHMVETLNRLLNHLDGGTGSARVVVWAHNSHLGDARATEMGRSGELNVGQLVREQYAGQAMLVGFTTHTGTVTAASRWGGEAERKAVRPSIAGSYERLLHDAGIARMMLPLRTDLDLASALATERLERAIGVLYLPGSERQSHYFRASLPMQFDVVLHFDETRAVEPLERSSKWLHDELAETYPSGI